MAVSYNHIGHCVADLERSRRFYEKALEFTHESDLVVEGEMPAKLLRLDLPLNLTAVYLKRDGLVLELLHYPNPGTVPYRPRAMNEPGLTHISLTVTDIPDALSRVAEYGGEVLEETNLGQAVFVKDPDGQLIELLAAR